MDFEGGTTTFGEPPNPSKLPETTRILQREKEKSKLN